MEKNILKVLDDSNKRVVAILSNDLPEHAYDEIENPNILIASADLVHLSNELLNQLAEICVNTKNDLTHAIISDVGCGIGNAGHMIGSCLKADEGLPHLQHIELRGLEKHDIFAEEARENFAKVTDNFHVFCADMNTAKEDVLNQLVHVDDLGDREVAVVYCNDPLKGDFQQMLEKKLIDDSPLSAFFIFPKGLKGTYDDGLRSYGRCIFQKVKEVVNEI